MTVPRCMGVAVQGGRGLLVPQDAGDIVDRYAVRDQPGGVGVPQVVEAQPTDGMPRDVLDCVTFGREFLGHTSESYEGASKAHRGHMNAATSESRQETLRTPSRRSRALPDS